MVCIRICTACKLGDHQNCENTKNDNTSMCSCNCNGRTDEQIRQDTFDWVRKIIKADIENNSINLEKEFSKTVDKHFWNMV